MPAKPRPGIREVSRPAPPLPTPRPFSIRAAVRRLRRVVPEWKTPVVGEVAEVADALPLRERNRARPFRALVSCVLSLRTKDETTRAATERLFAAADTPEAMAALSEKRLAKLIYPVGFYNNKARQIREICRRLVDEFDGETPRDIDTLVTLPGVGRKTANLVVTVGHGLPGICVDIHVHRISNRWGYIETRSPDESERALRAQLPKAYWIEYNDLLVAFGQNCCKPVSPHCSTCPLNDICPRRGVERWR